MHVKHMVGSWQTHAHSHSFGLLHVHPARSICVHVLMQVRMGSPRDLGTSAEWKGNGAVDADVEKSRGTWGAAGT